MCQMCPPLPLCPTVCPASPASAEVAPLASLAPSTLVSPSRLCSVLLASLAPVPPACSKAACAREPGSSARLRWGPFCSLGILALSAASFLEEGLLVLSFSPQSRLGGPGAAQGFPGQFQGAWLCLPKAKGSVRANLGVRGSVFLNPERRPESSAAEA